MADLERGAVLRRAASEVEQAAEVAAGEAGRTAGDGVRELNLVRAGTKRRVDTGKGRRRASQLVDTFPSARNQFNLGDDGELALSAQFVPDWLDPEFGAGVRADREGDEISTARFAVD